MIIPHIYPEAVHFTVPDQDGFHVILRPENGRSLPERDLNKVLTGYDKRGCARCKKKPQAQASFHVIRRLEKLRAVCPLCLRKSDRVLATGASNVLDYGRLMDRRIAERVEGKLIAWTRPAFHLEVHSLGMRNEALAKMLGEQDVPHNNSTANTFICVPVDGGTRTRRAFSWDGEDEAALIAAVVPFIEEVQAKADTANTQMRELVDGPNSFLAENSVAAKALSDDIAPGQIDELFEAIGESRGVRRKQ